MNHPSIVKTSEAARHSLVRSTSVRRVFMTMLTGMLGLLLLSAPANAQLYTWFDIGSLGGQPQETFGSGINSSGQVTGMSRLPDGSFHAFLYSAGSIVDLGTLGGTGSYGTAINDSGQVTGAAMTSESIYHAFLYSNGAMTDIGAPSDGGSSGTGINAQGQVSGYRQVGDVVLPFRYSNGTTELFGTLGGPNSIVYGINASGHMTGWSETSMSDPTRHPVLITNVVQDINPNAVDSSGYAINASGQITGVNLSRGFLYSNGTMIDLGDLGGGESRGLAINSAGHVTGASLTSGAGSNHAFLYRNGQMIDLNSAIDPANPLPGDITLVEATAINDCGWIVANGLADLSLRRHAYLLVPIRRHAPPHCRMH
jgi:probable HAF family extracellular repeat protein